MMSWALNVNLFCRCNEDGPWPSRYFFGKYDDLTVVRIVRYALFHFL